MPVPSLVTDLSTTASSNSPAGSETPADGDNYLRALSAFIAQIYSGTVNITLGDASGDTITVNAGIVSCPNGLNFDGNTLHIDATNNTVGVAKAADATYKLDVNGRMRSGTFEPSSTSVTGTGVNLPAANTLGFFVANALRGQIDSNGNLSIGVTTATNTPNNGVSMIAAANATQFAVGHASGTATGTGYLTFAYNAGLIGSITQNGTTGVLFNTTSDIRLKTAIVPLGDQGDVIDAIRVREFEFIAEPGKKVKGFVAQELIEVAPEAVSVGETWGVDFSKLMPPVVRELQSIRQRLAAIGA